MSELEREVRLRDERLTDTLQQVTTAQDNLLVHHTITTPSFGLSSGLYVLHEYMRVVYHVLNEQLASTYVNSVASRI